MGSIHKTTKAAVVTTASAGALVASAASSAFAAAFALTLLPESWLARRLGGGWSRDENRSM